MTAALERRYAALLRLYPARCHRDEMLDTALQAARADQRWPSAREVASLLVGAARARTGADAHRSPAAFARSAGRLAALALLMYAGAHDLIATLGLDVPMLFGAPLGFAQPEAAALAALVLHGGAIVALAHGRPGRAVLWTTAGAAASLTWQARWGWDQLFQDEAAWPALLAVPLVAALARGALRERSSPAGWLIGIPFAVFLLPTTMSMGINSDLHLQPRLGLVVVAVALTWSVIDPRVPIAVGALTLTYLLTYLAWLPGLLGEGTVLMGLAVVTSPPILLFGLGALLARRRVQL